MCDVVLVAIKLSGRLVRRAPLRRQQRGKIVLIGHARQTGEHVAQVSEGILAVTPARYDDRVEDGGALTGTGIPDEQPVLLANRQGPDGVFHQISVELGFAVVDVRGQSAPANSAAVSRRPRRHTHAAIPILPEGRPAHRRRCEIAHDGSSPHPSMRGG